MTVQCKQKVPLQTIKFLKQLALFFLHGTTLVREISLPTIGAAEPLLSGSGAEV